MKYSTTLFLLFITISGFSQKIKIKESTESIGGGKNPAFIVSIYGATRDEVESKWKSTMKDNKGKVSTKDEVFADNAIISSINGNNTIDIYAKAEKVSDGETKLTVAFDLGGAFISASSPAAQYKEAKKLVYDFAVRTTKESITDEQKTAEKQLSKLQDQQRDLEKQLEKSNSSIQDYKSKIVDYEKRIKEAEADIVKNKSDQENKKKELEAQKKVVEAITAKVKAVE